MNPVKKNFLAIFGSNILNLIVGILTTPIIVRVLGPNKYGKFSVVLSIVTVLMIVTNLGMFDGIRKHIGAVDDSEELTETFRFYTQLSIIVLLLVSLSLLIGKNLGFIQQIFGPQFSIYIYLILLMIVFRQFFRLARGTLIGLNHSGYSESIRGVRDVLFPAFAIPLMLYSDAVVGVLIGDILAVGLTAVGGLALVARKIPPFKIFTISSPTLSPKKILQFNTSTVVLVSMVVSLYHADILLLQFFGFEEQVGYYKSALIIAEFLWFVPMTIQTTLLHSVSELWENGQINRISIMASRITRHVVTFTLLLVIGVAVLAEPLVHVYFGQEFSAAVTPLLILLPGSLGYAVIRPIYTIGQSTGKLGPLIALTSIAATTNIVLNVLFIPRYGMTGAAVATSVGYGSMLVLHIIGSRWIGFNPLKQIYFVRLLVTTTVTAVFLYLIAGMISGDFVSLLVIPPIGFVIYAGMAVAVGLVTDEEVEALKKGIQTQCLTKLLG